MHLAIDAVGAKHGGAATVACAVVDAALASRAVSRVTVFCSASAIRRFHFPDDERVSVVEAGSWTESPAGRIGWLWGGFERDARRRGALAFLALNGGGFRRAGRIERRTVLIQQPLPFWHDRRRYVGLGSEARIRVIARSMRRCCSQARTVVVQSPSMARSVSEAFKVHERKIVVLPPSPPVLNASASRRVVERSAAFRLLYIGSDAVYKNVEIIGKAAALLSSSGTPVEIAATLGTDHELCRAGLARPLGYLGRDDLAAELRSADVLIMPSLAETIGLPMLEAMASGVPVMAADRGYAHDLCGEAALYFDPLDAESLAQTLRSLFFSEGVADRLRTLGMRRAATLRDGRPYERLIDLAIH